MPKSIPINKEINRFTQELKGDLDFNLNEIGDRFKDNNDNNSNTENTALFS